MGSYVTITQTLLIIVRWSCVNCLAAIINLFLNLFKTAMQLAWNNLSLVRQTVQQDMKTFNGFNIQQLKCRNFVICQRLNTAKYCSYI